MQTDEEWFEDHEVPDELEAKLLALKVCRNRSLAFGSSEKALEISTPVLKMFASILENNGSLVPEANEKCLTSLMTTCVTLISLLVPKLCLV